MAIIYCDECGYEYSNKAVACPKCGCPTEDEVAVTKMNERPKKSSFKIVLGVFFIVFLLASGALYALGSGILNTAMSGIEAIDEAIPPQVLIDEEIQLKEDGMVYYSIPLNRNGELQITYKVKSGPGIDVYFVDEDNYYRWKRSMEEGTLDQEFGYFSDLSSYGTSLSDRSSKLTAGQYYLILDNSDWGDTIPPWNFNDDIATLDMKITFE